MVLPRLLGLPRCRYTALSAYQAYAYTHGVRWNVQEVQLLQSLHHPNIIAMLDSFIEDNELIIVFEWALGGDLKRLIRRQIESGVAMDESLIWGHFTQVS